MGTECKLIDFDSVRVAFRGLGSTRIGDAGKVISVCPRARRERKASAQSTHTGALRRAKLTALIRLRAERAARLADEYGSDYECLASELGNILASLGLHDIKVPAGAGRSMDRSLSYRVPNDAWHALHSLDWEIQDQIVLQLAFALHDRRISVRAKGGVADHSAHLLLPLEIAGEDALRRIAPALLRALPCFGLDRGMDNPSEYDTIFAYESEGVFDSLSYEPLVNELKRAHDEFVDLHCLHSIDELADFIVLYGESCSLLGENAACVLADRRTAVGVACRIV